MPREDYRGISIKEKFAENIEKFIIDNPELGYNSITQFLEDAGRRRLEDLRSHMKEPPRFEQVNCDEHGTKILDRKIHEVIQIYIQPQGIKCSLDLTDDCEHVKFALAQPDIREAIKRHRKEGWKLPDV